MAPAISHAPPTLAQAALKVRAPANPNPADRAITNTAKDFEAVFLRQSLESILPDARSGAFGGGTAADMWRSMLADHVSAVLAERGVLGLAGILPARDEAA